TAYVSDGATHRILQLSSPAVAVGSDTIAPLITPPSNISVDQNIASGINATDPALTAFFAGATATDNVGVAAAITHNAPLVLSAGVTTVTFAVVDNAGNAGYAVADITVNNIAPTGWTSTQAAFVLPEDLAYGTPGYVIANSLGSLYHSPDKTTWTEVVVGTGAGLLGVTWNGTQYVAVGGSGAVKTSIDGINWTTQNSGLGIFDVLNDIHWTGAQYIAVGSAGTTQTAFLATSPDAVTWTIRPTPAVGALWAVTSSSPTLIVAVGNAGIITSTDGVTWTKQTVPTTAQLYAVSYANGQFVAGGNGGKMLSSPDAITWTVRAGTTNRAIRDIAWNGFVFGAVGDVSSYQISYDGIKWTLLPGNPSTLAPQFPSIIVVNSQFITIDTNGAVYTQK
ncbi:MAG: HYR domain-containing protein, partial [Mariprofundaceae bacterium]|nr:HYR domain-containing protein [Mariprofundaceae bacterium]